MSGVIFPSSDRFCKIIFTPFLFSLLMPKDLINSIYFWQRKAMERSLSKACIGVGQI